MNLGENIYNFRTQLNYSQGALAEELDVSRQSISKWENGSAVPELDKLLKMAALFEVSLDELVGISPVQKTALVKETIIEKRMPVRDMIGFALMLFGMVFFLLSMFWGNHLKIGEEMGEIISICIVLFSIALLATYSFKVLAGCAVIYFVYSVVCFGILHVTNLLNYLFVTLAGTVILIWFIVWGLRQNKDEETV